MHALRRWKPFPPVTRAVTGTLSPARAGRGDGET